MNRVKLSNISLADFRTFLFDMGCKREEQGTKDDKGGYLPSFFFPSCCTKCEVRVRTVFAKIKKSTYESS
jgi:hypothetical protein